MFALMALVFAALGVLGAQHRDAWAVCLSFVLSYECFVRAIRRPRRPGPPNMRRRWKDML